MDSTEFNVVTLAHQLRLVGNEALKRGQDEGRLQAPTLCWCVITLKEKPPRYCETQMRCAEALKAYSQALALVPFEPATLSNRCLLLLRLGSARDAFADGQICMRVSVKSQSLQAGRPILPAHISKTHLCWFRWHQSGTSRTYAWLLCVKQLESMQRPVVFCNPDLLYVGARPTRWQSGH